jgi:hypothetical protein
MGLNIYNLAPKYNMEIESNYYLQSLDIVHQML